MVAGRTRPATTPAVAGLTAAGSTIIADASGAGPEFPAPFASLPGRVKPEWIDHNGHLNLAYYIVLFDVATDLLWDAVGLGTAYRARTGLGTFAVETHTLYLGELLEGDATEASSWVLGVDRKRLHVAHELRRVVGGGVSARQELMYLTVDLAARRSIPWPEETLAGLQRAQAVHAGVPRPDWVGRRLAMPPPA